MNILFCGSCLPRVFESKIAMLSVAGNQYQNNLILNLKLNGQVHILSYIGIPLEVSEEEIIATSQDDGYQPIIASNKKKGLIDYRKCLKRELIWADIVITYNSMYPWFGVGRLAKKMGKKSVLILADYTPPIEENSKFRKMYSYFMGKDFALYQKVILLSSGSSKYIKNGQDFEIVNGCIDMKKFKNIGPAYKKKCTYVVYTGVLSAVTGIDLLLSAFELIKNPNYRLLICGQGNEMDNIIRQAAAKDDRIEYRGFLSTEEYLKTIAEADILVNPRNMKYVQNQNNFPSKILEYLASGRKIISTKFSGYQEYREVIEFVDSTDIGISKGILKVSEEDSNEIYKRNRDFVQRFSWEKQIIKFLN